jgi:hypothetical protein
MPQLPRPHNPLTAHLLPATDHRSSRLPAVLTDPRQRMLTGPPAVTGPHRRLATGSRRGMAQPAVTDRVQTTATRMAATGARHPRRPAGLKVKATTDNLHSCVLPSSLPECAWAHESWVHRSKAIIADCQKQPLTDRRICMLSSKYLKAISEPSIVECIRLRRRNVAC